MYYCWVSHKKDLIIETYQNMLPFSNIFFNILWGFVGFYASQVLHDQWV